MGAQVVAVGNVVRYHRPPQNGCIDSQTASARIAVLANAQQACIDGMSAKALECVKNWMLPDLPSATDLNDLCPLGHFLSAYHRTTNSA